MDSVVGGGILDLAWDGNYLWGIDDKPLTLFNDEVYIVKISPANGNILDYFPTPNAGSSMLGDATKGIAYGNGYLWVLNYLDDTIYAVNPSTGQVNLSKSVELDDIDGSISGGAWDGQYFWFGESDSGSNNAKIHKVDVDSSTIIQSKRIPAESIHDLAFIKGWLFVTVQDVNENRYFYQINPTSISIVEQYDRSPCVYGIAYDGNYIWGADWCDSPFSPSHYDKYSLEITPLPTTTITTTVPSNSTTTSTGDDEYCPSELIYGEDSEETELLRYFRDNVLSQTSEGQELIRLYYQWSPSIVKAMEGDEEFKEEIKETIEGILPLIR